MVPSITYTFFGILPVHKNFVGQRIQFPSVKRVRLLYGVFVSCPEQVDYLCIIHWGSLPFFLFLTLIVSF